MKTCSKCHGEGKVKSELAEFNPWVDKFYYHAWRGFLVLAVTPFLMGFLVNLVYLAMWMIHVQVDPSRPSETLVATAVLGMVVGLVISGNLIARLWEW